MTEIDEVRRLTYEYDPGVEHHAPPRGFLVEARRILASVDRSRHSRGRQISGSGVVVAISIACTSGACSLS